MTELITALAWVLVGILLGGLVVFAWHSDYVKPETHQAVIEAGKAHREYRDELIRAWKYVANGLFDDVALLKLQLAKVHSKRDPKTGRYVK